MVFAELRAARKKLRQTIDGRVVNQRVRREAATQPFFQFSDQGQEMHRIDSVRNERFIQPNICAINIHVRRELINEPCSDFIFRTPLGNPGTHKDDLAFQRVSRPFK